MNIFKASLCALLMTACTTNLVPKKSLESYVSPDKNYSLKLNPALYGFNLQKHTTEQDSTFRDIYESTTGWSVVFCSKVEGNIDKMFEQYLFGYTQIASDVILNAKPEKKITYKQETPKYITINDNPAITGGVELLLTPIDTNTYNKQTFKIILTLSRDNNRLYTFASMFYQVQPDAELASMFNENVVNSFKPLK